MMSLAAGSQRPGGLAQQKVRKAFVHCRTGIAIADWTKLSITVFNDKCRVTFCTTAFSMLQAASLPGSAQGIWMETAPTLKKRHGQALEVQLMTEAPEHKVSLDRVPLVRHIMCHKSSNTAFLWHLWRTRPCPHAWPCWLLALSCQVTKDAPDCLVTQLVTTDYSLIACSQSQCCDI